MNKTSVSLVLTIILLAVYGSLSAQAVKAEPNCVQPGVQKGPYLIYEGLNTQMTILWQLDAAEPNTAKPQTARPKYHKLEWGPDKSCSKGNAQVPTYGADHQYKYTIKGLKPGTRYYYRVKDVGQGSFFTAPPQDAKNLKFMAYGDSRNHPNWHNRVNAAMVSTFNSDPGYQTFTLFSGDWVDHGKIESSWNREFFGRSQCRTLQLQANLPIQGCIGNHEIFPRDKVGDGDLYLKYWPYPYVDERYWSFDYGPAHFAVIDQYSVKYNKISSRQLKWLKNDLSKSKKKWKFLLLHCPGYTAGKRSKQVHKRIQPLCEQYGVDMVFAGHKHIYAHADVKGVKHITTGGGGATLSNPDMTKPHIVTAAKALHFCKVDIQGDKLFFEAVKDDGTVIDKFTITHQPQALTTHQKLEEMGANIITNK